MQCDPDDSKTSWSFNELEDNSEIEFTLPNVPARFQCSWEVKLAGSMASSLDSKPYFSSRAMAVGFTAATLKSFVDAGIDTLAGFAFFCTYQPGAVDDTTLVDATKAVLSVQNVPLNIIASVRRLFYEAHTMYVADLKQRVTATDEDAPKKIPTAERAARHTEQKARLTGLLLEGDLECSHALLDLVMQQYEQNEVKYLQLSVCTSREQEQGGVKKDAAFALDSDGQLKFKASQVLAHADLSTDLKARNAFTRRGLAYDQSGLLDFNLHASWVDRLFRAMQRAVPEGFNYISMQQVCDADKELWAKISDDCRSGIVPTPGQPRPIEEAMKKWMPHPDVLYFLLPLPAKRENSYGPAKEKDKDVRFQPKGKGKGKGKNKGKQGSQGKSNTTMPSNCGNKTAEGRNLCFPYNSPAGCQHAKPGAACRRGLHVCAKILGNGKICQDKHSAVECSAK